MQQYILHNDEFILADQPVFAVSNRGFKYGDGLFESMRMAGGKLKYAEQHAGRLKEGMEALKMDGSTLMDDYFLRQKTAELAKKNKFKGNARFRLSIYRQGEGLYTPENNKSGYVLESSVLNEPEYVLNKKGLIIDVYDELTKPINKLSNYKTSNALIYVMAGLYKKQNRLDDVFMLNQNGFLCESMTSNVFVVYDKQIYTPALSEGCVAGVMRNVVMELARNNDIPIIEAQLNPEVLREAEEVFVSNAVTGIRWVMGYGRKRYFNENAKLLSNLLNAAV
jgi:branched-chain amino acid aminotransferase